MNNYKTLVNDLIEQEVNEYISWNDGATREDALKHMLDNGFDNIFVYKFDELSDEAKQTAIERERERVYEFDLDYLSEYLQTELEMMLEECGARNLDVRVRYSLGYCQGDGASFTGDFDFKAYHVTVDTNSWGVHYSHNRSVDVKEMNSLKTDQDAPDSKWSAMQTMIEDIGMELEKIGYSYIESITSDESIIDNINANEYEFTAEGVIA